jgi:UDP-N-acetylmuramoylalanine--D-glutamate ligase
LSKKIIILGAGESGVGAALLAKQKGYNVFVSDASAIKPIYQSELEANHIPFESGTHDVERILEADEVMKSPGIPEKSELVKQIRAKGIPVISEIEFGYRYKGASKIIAITGSNGKTTTTSLLYHICKVAGQDAAIVGNIGFSFARQIAQDPKALYVIEVSSFQLDDIHSFRPDIAILLNITEDHLDRYNYQFENYIKSKLGLLKIKQSKTALFIA